jgi:hypothetical protein
MRMTHDATAPVVPSASIEVDDVDACHVAALRAGAEIVHPLTDEPWGCAGSSSEIQTGTSSTSLATALRPEDFERFGFLLKPIRVFVGGRTYLLAMAVAVTDAVEALVKPPSGPVLAPLSLRSTRRGCRITTCPSCWPPSRGSPRTRPPGCWGCWPRWGEPGRPVMTPRWTGLRTRTCIRPMRCARCWRGRGGPRTPKPISPSRTARIPGGVVRATAGRTYPPGNSLPLLGP